MSQESVEPNAVQEWPVGQNGRECARLKVQPCGLFHVPGYELALVQRQAAWALGSLGDAAAIGPLWPSASKHSGYLSKLDARIARPPKHSQRNHQGDFSPL